MTPVGEIIGILVAIAACGYMAYSLVLAFVEWLDE